MPTSFLPTSFLPTGFLIVFKMIINNFRVQFLVLLLLVTTPLQAEAAELLYFYSDACVYCEQWDDEVGSIYSKTEEANFIKLRRVDIHGQTPKDIEYVKGVIYTPTFVAIDGGREIGRIVGYGSDMFFWQHMEILLKDIKKLKATPKSPCVDGVASKGGLSC